MYTLPLSVALLAIALPALGGRSPSLVARASSCTLAAAGSGKDDAPAFLAAVKSCDTTIVPKGVTLNISSPLDMTGINNKHINIQGKISFNPDLGYWTGHAFYVPFQAQLAFWLLGGNHILLDGGGTLDGQGQAWYDAFASNSSLGRPIILTVSNASDVTVQNIAMVNAPEWFNLVNEAKGVVFDNVTLSAVSTSKNAAKNTDGWDIYRSDNVTIKNSNINNGDDCVSFKPNTTNVLVSNLQCNGSHGISVGSLGQYAGVYDIVENVLATDIKMSNAQNGARIKAWAGKGVGSGIVKNVTFTNFIESNVDNPIVIDQCYETSASDCSEYPSNTYIQDVWFDSISGTSSGKEKSVVGSLSCSPDGRCSDINANNLTLSPPSKYGAATYTCQNVNITGTSAGLFPACSTT
ncbi:hypothetical protein PUNSTDRAFT_105379 [Punctularia strigosozonata HHB-11173 SS5]|uniref:uncharacterized protein n=1 Tax=Punctularia strigosozonata (strain HHB-11173) TaxID=741275 RepID=UPI000441681E|nr:uncharacterized protein PUNSTDRAFT_105379 [Punctularia strigosozonata HHB-11173 SS5]EIN06930.1 hypothetical protein PUNSTDRAFT_105379 [Punctularia strigosozonata HHB-11173 SS5]